MIEDDIAAALDIPIEDLKKVLEEYNSAIIKKNSKFKVEYDEIEDTPYSIMTRLNLFTDPFYLSSSRIEFEKRVPSLYLARQLLKPALNKIEDRLLPEIKLVIDARQSYSPSSRESYQRTSQTSCGYL